MARTSLIAKNFRQNYLQKLNFKKYKAAKNLKLYKQTYINKFFCNLVIEKIIKKDFPAKIKNRCWKTGKSRGFYRFFGLCRNAIRELAHKGHLPGVVKSSW